MSSRHFASEAAAENEASSADRPQTIRARVMPPERTRADPRNAWVRESSAVCVPLPPQGSQRKLCGAAARPPTEKAAVGIPAHASRLCQTGQRRPSYHISASYRLIVQTDRRFKTASHKALSSESANGWSARV